MWLCFNSEVYIQKHKAQGSDVVHMDIILKCRSLGFYVFLTFSTVYSKQLGAKVCEAHHLIFNVSVSTSHRLLSPLSNQQQQQQQQRLHPLC